MAHSHEHTHRGSPHNHGKAFAIGILLNISFVIIEVVYGILSNSSALLADAGHNASDVLGLIFAWTAAWLSTLKPKGKYTYGLRKSTILASLLNATLLFGAVAIIAMDAIHKLKSPAPVAGTQVMLVAGIGFFINSLTALLFLKGQKNDLNIKGAFLHMAADAVVSLGVVIAGLLIHITGKTWIDPVTSFVIIGVILWGTWKLFTESVEMSLDAVPRHINLDSVRNYLLSFNQIKDIHDLHIWSMSTTNVALTAHLVVHPQIESNFLLSLQEGLKKKFNIEHTTFQIENNQLFTNCNTDC
jgi:cobalt-zinc-cadmium efflux system protein